jgi:hypothetical protein
MDRRLLDYNPETEIFEAGAFAFDESQWPGGTSAESVFSEADEMEHAAGLLEVASETELDRFLGDLIDKAGRAIGSIARSPTKDALAGILKAAAKRTLPVVARAVGQRLGSTSDSDIGARVVQAAGKYFGLELEGLSPEDQEFEAAKRFVRFAGEAAKNALAVPAGMPPEAAAARAAHRYAPGLLSNIPGPRPADPGARHTTALGGRWVRRGQNIIVVGS